MRGGFIFLDDFWGEYEWENVQEQFQKILPEYEIKDLPLSSSDLSFLSRRRRGGPGAKRLQRAARHHIRKRWRRSVLHGH